ncbi:MAG: hypothetical protein ACE37H_15550 [Phycisphaeraceae bacterium]
MPKTQHRAWLCNNCGERCDPTMGLCWNCGHNRDGQPPVEPDEEGAVLLRCPRCAYDLRGNLGGKNCPECGAELTLSREQKDLYWVPPTTKIGAVAKLLRSPLRMMPIAILAWFLFGVFWLAGEARYFFDGLFSVNGPAEFFVLLVFLTAMFFTLATLSGIMVQGLQPPDEEQTEASVSTGNGFILRTMKHGWGRYLFWLAWAALLVCILLFYGP